MSDDWKPGDVAVCIDDRWMNALNGRATRGPAINSQNIVRDAQVLPGGILYLGLIGWPGDYFQSDAFKKLPPHEEDEDDREAIAHLIYAPILEPI